MKHLLLFFVLIFSGFIHAQNSDAITMTEVELTRMKQLLDSVTPRTQDIKTLTSKAEAGDVKAQLELGYLHQEHNSHVNPTDYKKAAFWFKKATEGGDSNGMYELALLYLNGRGVDKNALEAKRLLIFAAEKGLPLAQIELGKYYRDSDLGDRDFEQALKWFKAAVKQVLGSNAYAEMGIMFDRGLGVNKNPVIAYALYLVSISMYEYTSPYKKHRDAIKGTLTLSQESYGQTLSRDLFLTKNLNDLSLLLEKASIDAKYKNPLPSVEVGIQQLNRYDDTSAGEKNAREILLPFAQAGDAEAQFYVGTMYEEGRGFPKNTALALDWYLKSANQGYESAQTQLAYIYEKGDIVKQDHNKAFFWMSKASIVSSQFSLMGMGRYYESGIGVAANKQTALSWYRKALTNKDGFYYRSAQALIARILAQDDALSDLATAYMYSFEATAHGEPVGSMVLAKLYFTGRGAKQSNLIAYALAAVETYDDKVDKEFSDLRKKLSYTMNAREIADAKALVFKFPKTYGNSTPSEAVEQFLRVLKEAEKQ
jgi:uncharacterized protein